MTMGWIVVLQVGLLLIDRFHFGVHLDTGKRVAVVVILVAQGYLLLGPTGAADDTPRPSRPAAGAEPGSAA